MVVTGKQGSLDYTAYDTLSWVEKSKQYQERMISVELTSLKLNCTSTIMHYVKWETLGSFDKTF